MSKETTLFDEKLISIIGASVDKSITEQLCSYKSPLNGFIQDAVKRNETKIRKMIDGAVDGLVDTDSFETELCCAIRSKISKTLISKLGGQLEKQINELKHDPATRARITLAVDTVMSEIVLRKVKK